MMHQVKKKSLRIITLGCSKNLVDSEKLLGQLPEDAYMVEHEGSGEADIVIVNTCGFIHDAREESIDTILELVDARQQGMVGEVLVTGCLSQRYMDDLRKEIPEVDAWFGVHNQQDIIEYLQAAHKNNNSSRVLSTPMHYAYLKIAEGCDRTCSFCAIPLIRGAYVSVPVDDLVKETEILASQGVRELILIAQDTSYYGLDISGKPMLAGLLRRLCRVDGIHWIRLQYAYPHHFSDEIIQVMASEPKICKYLDIPLQHINDHILQSMRRGHNRETTLGFLASLRQHIPNVALRTTLMVGYPGETQDAFEELLAFVAETRFDRLGVFTYSPEEGTRAYGLDDSVPQYLKEQRANAIMELQENISLEINSSKIGKTFEVIIDRLEGEYLVGRTEFDSPEVDNEVLITKTGQLAPGQFARVLVTGADAFDLYASFVES